MRAVCLAISMAGLTRATSMPPAPRALNALGPAYIKFGQVLSTRPDVVGDEFAISLRVLARQASSVFNGERKGRCSARLGQAVETLFSSFSEPVAAASLHKSTRRILLDTVMRSRSKSCARVSSGRFAKTLTPSILQPRRSKSCLPRRAACDRWK